MNETVKKALERARTQIGVHEIGTSNTGREVDRYLRTVGCAPGNPWCAAFVYWCIHEAAPESTPFIRTAACAVIDAWARDRDILFDTPQPGDVFLLYGVTRGVYRAHHTGFVVGVSGEAFQTIEGNTNLGGSREGTSVMSRRRYDSNGTKFVRWGSLVSTGKEVQYYTLKLDARPPIRMPVIGGRAMCPVRTWGDAMGFNVEWNDEKQTPFLDGREVSTEVSIIDGCAYAPIRDLVATAGLSIEVDANTRCVSIGR